MLDVLHKYVEDVIVRKDVESALTFVAEDVLGMGMGDQGVVRDKSGLRDVLTRDKRGDGAYSVRYGEMDVRHFPPSSGVICGTVHIDYHLYDETISSSIVQFASMRKDGDQWFIAAVAASPIAMSTESIDAYPLAFADTTLTRLKKELTTLAETIPGGVATLQMDDQLSVLYANHSFREMFGEADALLPRFHPDDREKAHAAIVAALQDKLSGFELETRFNTASGGVIWLMLGGGFIQSGPRVEIHCVLIDITTRKTYEEKQRQHELALHEAVEAAEAATRTKSAFLANMSHEIRTPMNGVLGFAELALDDEALSGRTREYLEKIRISAAGLLNIINDILDVSKIEAGKFELDPMPFRIQDVLTHCETVCGITAHEKGVTLRIEADAIARRKLYGDATKLRQVLLSLLSNAIKFSGDGAVLLRVASGPGENGFARVHFEVRDNGVGMEPSQVQKVLEPFVQADSSTTRRFGGTGLGLPIPNSFIELMGGKLAVDSTPGKGSMFGFSLGFETMDATGDESAEEQAVQAGKRPVFAGDALVYEDNTINQQVIREHLSRIGLNATVVPNGKLAVDVAAARAANNSGFDVILMDISMPVMDGLEATAILRGMGIETPIIAMTANALKTERDSYLAGGMNDYIGKPFVAQELWTCLLRYLEPVEILALPPTIQAPPQGKPGGVIDRSLGLRNASGDAGFYGRVVEKFEKQNSDFMPELHQLMTEEKWPEAQRMAHTLKGLARLIGAEGLSDSAYEVEKSLKTRQTAEPEKLQRLEDDLRAVLADIASEQAEPAAAPNLEAEPDEAVLMMQELLEKLGRRDADCLEFLEKNFWIIAPQGEICAELLDLVEKGDFPAAIEMAERLREIIAKERSA